ncbi:rhomboid family intramembrane serine protease [Paracrocinitomix mangrovi]|uniref:rhomboid family intramembrane serine protease n=1 Tax=Paracrocinitomix mangrovi TaxID=2862509 RepID=UPI001C8DC822|nr:rhomboid family intramembrane serine protease [Paracrocinitomix mangrovi]UKN01944.1 rhomboid family intramembrane serine protease [Paracrocinitomix mangrovi]
MQEQSIGQYLKNLIRNSGMYGKLILINTIVFLISIFVGIIGKLYVINGALATFFGIFGAPGIKEVIYKPWTLVTQLFTHLDFGHYFLNMIMLFLIGRIFVQLLGEKKLLWTYLLGGIFGYLINALAIEVFPVYNHRDILIFGASGAVSALFGAVVAYRPKLQVHLLFFPNFGIPIIAFFIFYVLMNLIGMSEPEGQVSTAYFAHLGGALFGFLSVINVNSSKNFMNRLERFFSKFSLKGLFKRKPKMKVYTQDEVQEMDDDQYRDAQAAKQEQIDAILDKISKKGYEGLTKKEKELLFNESKRKK